MVDHPTLFAQMALKFADHPENIAVEALGHILYQSPLARAGFGGCSSIRRFADRVHHTDRDSAQRR